MHADVPKPRKLCWQTVDTLLPWFHSQLQDQIRSDQKLHCVHVELLAVRCWSSCLLEQDVKPEAEDLQLRPFCALQRLAMTATNVTDLRDISTIIHSRNRQYGWYDFTNEVLSKSQQMCGIITVFSRKIFPTLPGARRVFILPAILADSHQILRWCVSDWLKSTNENAYYLISRFVAVVKYNYK